MFALHMTGRWLTTLFEPLLAARDIWTGETVPLILFGVTDFLESNPIAVSR